jgi:Coenzyme PQQ synthesis protein D (PqqD)
MWIIGELMDIIQLVSIPVISRDVVSRIYDQEGVLVNTRKAQIKVINEVGAYIWSMLDGVRSVQEIARAVSTQYDVELDQAEQDTLEFVRDLSQNGLIETT